MGGEFQVNHQRKIKTVLGLVNIYAHNCRMKVYTDDGKLIRNPQTDSKWYDPSCSKYNEYERYDEPLDDGVKRSKLSGIINKWNTALSLRNIKRKPQKNASVAVEFVISATHSFHENWKKNELDRKAWNDYFTRAKKYYVKKYGADIILHTAVHWDEYTPHMHMIVAPIVRVQQKDTNKQPSSPEWKYSSSTFLGGPWGMREMQTEFNDAVAGCFGLNRGVEGSRAKHKDLEAYNREIAILEQELNDRLLHVEEREQQVKKDKKRLLKEKEEFEKEKKEHEKQKQLDADDIAEKAAAEFEQRTKVVWKDLKTPAIDQIPPVGKHASARLYRLSILPFVQKLIDYSQRLYNRIQQLNRQHEEDRTALQKMHEKDILAERERVTHSVSAVYEKKLLQKNEELKSWKDRFGELRRKFDVISDRLQKANGFITLFRKKTSTDFFSIGNEIRKYNARDYEDMMNKKQQQKERERSIAD